MKVQTEKVVVFLKRQGTTSLKAVQVQPVQSKNNPISNHLSGNFARSVSLRQLDKADEKKWLNRVFSSLKEYRCFDTRDGIKAFQSTDPFSRLPNEGTFLFLGVDRSPEQIFAEGLSQHSVQADDWHEGCDPLNYISSADLKVEDADQEGSFQQFWAKHFQFDPGWLYTIADKRGTYSSALFQAKDNSGIKQASFHIPSAVILGAHQVQTDGSFGEFVANSNYAG